MFTLTEIIKYLDKYKGQSVDELVEKLTDDNERQKNEEKERAINESNWYNALKGRYFLIDFNGASFVVVKVENDITSQQQLTKQPSYEIYRGTQTFHIRFDNREINKDWYDNPYEKFNYAHGRVKCREITEKEYEDYAKLYKATKAMFESVIL